MYGYSVMRIYLLCLLYLALYTDLTSSKLVQERIYVSIDGHSACFKRFNGTHEIGCSSAFGGNVGVLHIVKNVSDLIWVLEKGTNSPYVLAVWSNMFNVELLSKASKSGIVAGIALLKSENSSRPVEYSIDQKCPNAASSMYTNTEYESYCEKNPWNPAGSGMLFSKWDFPIFLIDNDKSIQNIISCFETFNQPNAVENHGTSPLCSMELRSHMAGTTNTKVCRRRSDNIFSVTLSSSYCDPLSDINIWGSTSPFTTQIADESVIFVTTSADSSSMFDNISPGADAAVSGIVTLLTVAKALLPFKETLSEANINILFAIFEGETWDYIGSSRMAYDINNGKFPFINETTTNSSVAFNFSKIHSFVDIKQMSLSKSKSIYMHTDPISNQNVDVKATTDDVIAKFKRHSRDTEATFVQTDPNVPLPPTSLQSFLKYHNISGVVLTDHEKQYTNMYYQSYYDDSDNLQFSPRNGSVTNAAASIARYAGIIASTLYEMATDQTKQLEADEEFAEQLLYCYLKNTNCTLFRENADESLVNFFRPEPAKMYVNVSFAGSEISHITRRILARVTGQAVNLNQTSCRANATQPNSLEYFPFVDNGTCIDSNVHFSEALSPAFILPNYNWSSGEYSTWTESQWKVIDARIFLKPTKLEEILISVIGVGTLIVSFIFVHYFKSRATVIFPILQPPTDC